MPVALETQLPAVASFTKSGDEQQPACIHRLPACVDPMWINDFLSGVVWTVPAREEFEHQIQNTKTASVPGRDQGGEHVVLQLPSGFPQC